jgi:hypothetical protein
VCIDKGSSQHFKNRFPGGHEEVEGTCKQSVDQGGMYFEE